MLYTPEGREMIDAILYGIGFIIGCLWFFGWGLYTIILEGKYHPDPYCKREIDEDSDEYKEKMELYNKIIHKRRYLYFGILLTVTIIRLIVPFHIPRVVDISQECTVNIDGVGSCFFEKKEEGVASLCGYIGVDRDDWGWERILYHDLDSQVAKSTQICTSGMNFVGTLKRDFFVSIPDECKSKGKFICHLSFIRTEDLFFDRVRYRDYE